MEKRTPHCKLEIVKALIAEGRVASTFSARRTAQEAGIDYAAMVEIVNNLNRSDFYKSMTTHADHTVWQDVYRPNVEPYGGLYIKLTVIDDVLIVSFKER